MQVKRNKFRYEGARAVLMGEQIPMTDRVVSKGS